MALPVVVVTIGGGLLGAVVRVLGIHGLRQAFVAGGLRGFARVLAIRVATRAIAYFTISRVTQYFFSSLEYIVNFNWNISDEEIDNTIKSGVNALANLAGSAVGTTIGGIGCAMGMVTINPQALAFVDEINEELGEEIFTAWAQLLRAGLRLSARSLFLNGYKSVRNWLKNSGIAEQILGKTVADAWGKPGGPVISFAKSWEDWLETVKPEMLKNFLEEMVDEGYEFCKEITIYIASRLDQMMGLQRTSMRDAVLGDQTILEIKPNREVLTEKYVLAGREEMVKTEAVNLLTQYQFIGNRDIGVAINGEPYIENSARREPKSISLIIEFRTSPTRPFKKPIIDNGIERIITPCYVVSNVERSKLDWERIKLACGGKNGYMYGSEYVVYNLISPQGFNRGRQVVYGQTKGDAKDIARAFIGLTDSQISSGLGGEDLFEGNRTKARGNTKPIVRIYPHRVTIVVGLDTTLPRGRRKLTSALSQSIVRFSVIDLWPDHKPFFFDDEINKLFTILN